MRRDLWLGIIGAVVLAGCDKPKVQSTDATPVTEVPVQATPPPAVAQATPESAPAASAGPKVDDEVFLVKRFSIPIDGGMRGFREGSKVKVVAIEGSKLTVAGNNVQFDVQAADISVTPPVVQSAPPSTSKGTASPAAAASSADLEKKKARNAITAEISNLQMALDRSVNASELTQKKIDQIYAVINASGRSGNSPESRARIAEVERLTEVFRRQTRESVQIKRELGLRKSDLNKLN